MISRQRFDRLIFIHGLHSSGQGFKATLLRGLFPNILTPDFPGSLEERMASLTSILGNTTGWTIIGSSFGGLMGALFTCQQPQQVKKLILLAPALAWHASREMQPPALPGPVSVPVVVYHGRRDEVIPLEPVRSVSEQTFTKLTFHVVDDDHRLRQTVQMIDWRKLISQA